MKKFYSLLTGFVVLFSAVGSASASEFDNSANQTVEYQGAIELSDTSSNVIMSDVLTFDEMAQKISDDYGISINEATKILSANSSINTLNASTASVTYRNFISTLDEMNGMYQPSMNFYCQTNEGGGYIAIQKIITWDLNRNDIRGRGSKVFEGTIKTYLENGQKIHYILNGDFYNTGSGKLNVGGSIDLGKWGSLNLSLETKTGHYSYSFNQKDIWVGPGSSTLMNDQNK